MYKGLKKCFLLHFEDFSFVNCSILMFLFKTLCLFLDALEFKVTLVFQFLAVKYITPEYRTLVLGTAPYSLSSL